MKRKILLTIFTLFVSVVAINFTAKINQISEEQLENGSYLVNNYTSSTDDGIVTMLDFASFLSDKKEHYPLSDEFVERYQQLGGGYIDYARQLGIPVDKQIHSPNQKWHFFDSWLFQSLDAGTITWDADARSRVYINLKSPELLLWIFEAAGVDPNKVRDAKIAAEQGRIAGTHVATIAKNMRDCVPWEDVIANMDKSKKMATVVNMVPTTLELTVGDAAAVIDAVVEPSNTTDKATWSVVEGSEYITITPDGDRVSIQAVQPGIAKVRVSYNDFVSAECFITVKEPDVTKIIGVPDVVDLAINKTITLSPLLNRGTSTFIYESSNPSIATISNDGVVTPVTNGSTTITISSIEYPDLSKSIQVEVFDHGTKEVPLSVERVLELAEIIRQSSGKYNSQEIFVSGKVKVKDDNGGFILSDLSNTNLDIKVGNFIYKDGVTTISENDVVVLKGFIQFNEDSVQFINKDDVEVEILINERGESTISLGNHLNAIVKVDAIVLIDSIIARNGEMFYFTVEPLEGFRIDKVIVNNTELTEIEGVYYFEVAGDIEIVIIAIDSSITTQTLARYDIKFDLGTRKTSKKIDFSDELLDTFELIDGNADFISAISQLDMMYGGGYGGRGDTNWYTGDMLKFGTQSVNGSLTLELSGAVNRVKISGYVADTTCQIRIGDSSSTDWSGQENDNMTTTFVCSDMNVANKETVEGGQTVTIVIDFESTTSLRIATLNNKPLYITGIEFINHVGETGN